VFKKPNVLLITIDSLRADHIGCLGYPKNTTPNIDALAKDGVIFSQAIATGNCTSLSFPSILTSTYPLEYKDCAVYLFNHKLSRNRKMISEILKEEGYTTAAFHSTPLLSEYYGYNRGFDIFEDLGTDIVVLQRAGELKTIKKHLKDLLKKVKVIKKLFFHEELKNFFYLKFRTIQCPYKRADLITKKALHFLETTKNNFFLWIHYMDVHHPYNPPKKYLKKIETIHISRRDVLRFWNIEKLSPSALSKTDLQIIRDLYDGEIHFMDDAISVIISQLERIGAYENTLIIITADHGDEFGEHGNFSHYCKLYDELIHVPLIMKGPGIPADTVIDHPVSLLDIAPTIVDYLGLDKVSKFQGESLLPLIFDNVNLPREGVISETAPLTSIKESHRLVLKSISFRTERWKYIRNINGRNELYDLIKDPHETTNLIDKKPNLAQKFELVLKRHIQRRYSNKISMRKMRSL